MPSTALERLREGCFAQIGGAGEALQTIASSTEAREAGKSSFRGALERLRGAWALLDTIGWSTTTQTAGVQIDLRDHHAALSEALELALAFAEDDATDLDTDTPDREAVIQSVTAFREFAITARGHINRLSTQDESRRR